MLILTSCLALLSVPRILGPHYFAFYYPHIPAFVNMILDRCDFVFGSVALVNDRLHLNDVFMSIKCYFLLSRFIHVHCDRTFPLYRFIYDFYQMYICLSGYIAYILS